MKPFEVVRGRYRRLPEIPKRVFQDNPVAFVDSYSNLEKALRLLRRRSQADGTLRMLKIHGLYSGVADRKRYKARKAEQKRRRSESRKAFRKAR
ncbi:hypothetical protein ACFL03_13260 [Thermodesulfobacteriota bacterium]